MATSLVLEMALILWILSEDCCLSKSFFLELRFSPCEVFLGVAS